MRLVAEAAAHSDTPVAAVAADIDARADAILAKRRWMLGREVGEASACRAAPLRPPSPRTCSGIQRAANAGARGRLRSEERRAGEECGRTSRLRWVACY